MSLASLSIDITAKTATFEKDLKRAADLGSTFATVTVAGFTAIASGATAAAVGFDRSCEHAALSLGASNLTVFRRITLPMILPGVTGGWLLAFINSFDEVTMSIFVTAPSTVTLPVRMYMYATESIDPLMAAASALMVAFTAAVMVLLDRLYGLDRILVGGK